MTVVDLQNLNIENLKLGKVGRAIKLFYNKEPIQICTSTLYTQFGVKSTNKEWSTFTEYNLDCSLNQSSSETSVAFRTFVEKLDEIIKELVKDNLSFFNSKTETANENFTYTPILKENKNYPKLMKIQLSRDKNGNFESFVFNEHKEKVPVNEDNITELLCKGKMFKTIIECVKVWYYNGKVGSIWKVVQLKFCEREQPKIDDGSEEDNTSKYSSTIVNKVYTQLMIDD